MTGNQPRERWRATVRLALATVGTTGVAIVLLTWLIEARGDAAYPAGLAIAVLALPVICVALVLWQARRQETIDRRFGLYED